MTDRTSGNSPGGSISSRDRITAAALELVVNQGFSAVTMSMVAETAHVSRQTLYNHFPDVEAIVVAAVRQHNDEAIMMLNSAVQIASTPTGKLEQLVRHAATLGAHGHSPGDVVSGLSAPARRNLQGYLEAVSAQIASILHAGQQTAEFRGDLAVEIDTILVARMLDGVMEAAARSTAPSQIAEATEAGIRTVLAAVRA